MRGFVMALAHRPHAGLGEPVLDDPAGAARAGAARAASSAAAPSGRRSRSTRRRTPSTSAPARRRRSTSRRSAPGADPRTDSLIAVDLQTGQLKWWQQQIAHNEWAYDTAQPPLVYNAKVGGKTRHIVSVATMEGVWFAYDAKTGAPIYQRVKVIDRVEHPSLQARPAGRGLPVVDRRPELLAGLVRPRDELRAQRRRRDGAPSLVQAQADADAEEAQARARRRLPRPRQRQLRPAARPAGTTTARSARSTSTRASASGSSTRRSPSAAASRRPRAGSASPAAATACSARSTRRPARCCGRSRPATRSRPGRPIYSVGGKEYIAITVGGTPTSSSGGTASQLQVFALGGSKQQSPPPMLPRSTDGDAPRRAGRSLRRRLRRSRRSASRASPPRRGAARIATEGQLVRPTVEPQRLRTSRSSTGRLLLGKPVPGARSGSTTTRCRSATDAQGRFRYRADMTLPGGTSIGVASTDKATVGGRALTAAQRPSLRAAHGGFSVGYKLTDLHDEADRGRQACSSPGA